MERHQRGERSGTEPAEIMSTYRDLGSAAGFDESYDVERATTEPGT
jgi:hypothetical protein